MNLNQNSVERFDQLFNQPQLYGLESQTVLGASILDFGIAARGGLRAGVELAKLTGGMLTDVKIVSASSLEQLSAVQCQTDFPLQSCIGSQYAGWPISVEKFFGMGSGPARMIRGREPVLGEYELVESNSATVLCLESRTVPDSAVVEHVAAELKMDPSQVKIAIAPTGSIAGTLQVVARCLETSLHKLHEIGFDLSKVRSGLASAPIPPVATDDLKGIGVTNDAILFGGIVDLWVDCPEEIILELGEKTPSSSSKDFGTPFYDLFKANQFDFYKIDPLLFSPAKVTFHNLQTGKSTAFGKTDVDLINQSFGRIQSECS